MRRLMEVLPLVLALLIFSMPTHISWISANSCEQRVVHNHFHFNNDSTIIGCNILEGTGAFCSKTNVRSDQGPPGKLGPQGDRGPPGLPGIAIGSEAFQNISDSIMQVKGDIGQVKATVMKTMHNGLTLIGHNSEGDYYVTGCEGHGCYKRDIVYDITLTAIRQLISDSGFCRQFLKYHCHGSILYSNHAKVADRRAWWVSGTGTRINRWAGASADYTCPCHDQGTCIEGWSCNCDRNDNVWRTDEGYITDKDLLPVTQLRFGDIGDSNEMGFHTLGKLECYA